MDNSDSGALEKREVVEVAKQNMNEGIQKSGGKKMKNETDKGKKLMMWFALFTLLGSQCPGSERAFCEERNPFFPAKQKGFEENVCGCRTLFVLVCVHFSTVFGTAERALLHLNPFNADCRLLCPHSEQMDDHRPHRCTWESVLEFLSAFPPPPELLFSNLFFMLDNFC